MSQWCRLRRHPWRARVPVLISAAQAGLMMGVAGCANVWGFQDGVLGSPDGGGEDSETPRRDADGAVHEAPGEPCTLTCVAAPPSGWSGPYELSETTGGPPAPAPAPCSVGAYPVEVYSGVASQFAPPALCDCECAPAVGSTCSAPAITLYVGAMCAAAMKCSMADVSSASCVDFDPTCGGPRMELGAPTPIAGECVAKLTSNVPDLGWTASARLCGLNEPSSGECNAGEVCTRAVGLPFESVYCIATAQLASCPPGPYSRRRVYYGGATDTRECSGCSCGAPSVTCFGGTVSTFNQAGCVTPPHNTWSAPESCMGIGGDKSGIYNDDAVPHSGPCAPTGGEPTGKVTPTTPTTICCTP
jgi:hypothetical protein